MSSLSNKSAQEISELLDEYGIKHGPVVDSTRSLYERKLKEAMAKGRKTKPSPDKTFYREEEQEEVVYEYRTPVRSEGAGDSGAYMRSRPEWNEREYEQEASYSTYSKSKPEYRGRDFADGPSMYDSPSTYRNSYLQSTPMKSQEAPKAQNSSRLVPLWIQFVIFLAIAVFLYLVFSNMEENESLKGIE
ncbi:emerin-like [Centropristis striata]|uniref:emerin-like n=1 Tax=Centropristis striata TaxID=184440 RepID=UPI0027E0389F|nr:emerin-like [Centropristis striata]